MTVDVSLPAKWRRYTAQVGATRRAEGTAAAARLASGWAVSFVRRQIATARDRRYDRRTGVDTIADFPGLELPEGVTYDDPVYYARISPRTFARVLKDARVTPHDVTFIDLGCGKGAALLMALDAGFRSVVGIERNDRLVPIARRNLAEYGARSAVVAAAEVIHDDVVNYAFPEEPSLIYMYNPFGAATLSAVMGNLEESLRRYPRPVVVAYYSPAHRDVLDTRPWLEAARVRSRRWAIYRTVEGLI